MFLLAIMISLGSAAEGNAPAKAPEAKAEKAAASKKTDSKAKKTNASEEAAPELEVEEAPATPPMPQGKVYGASDFVAPTVKLNDVLKDFEAYRNQTVTVEGKVVQVCEEKGCWIKIEDKNITVRAIMKGHAFSVPKELKNKKVRITGIMEQKELPVNVVRHYMKDEGRSADEIKKVTQPQKVFQFVVDAVQEM